MNNFEVYDIQHNQSNKKILLKHLKNLIRFYSTDKMPAKTAFTKTPYEER